MDKRHITKEDDDVQRRTSTQASWLGLFEKAVEFVVQGPRSGFRLEVLD
jgi:hypothetical protein